MTGVWNVISKRLASIVVDKTPRAKFAVLDRAGHSIGSVTGEQEELFKELVTEWQYRVEENMN